MLPESGSTWYLPRMIGWAKAAQLVFTGRTLTAPECLEWGLANEVVDDGASLTRAMEIAREIAANAPLAVQAAKRMMRMGWNEPFPEHVHHEYLQLLPLLASEDAKEGTRAVRGLLTGEVLAAITYRLDDRHRVVVAEVAPDAGRCCRRRRS